jgi:ubiquinol-cytochrome c reductase cytochrome c subunit
MPLAVRAQQAYAKPPVYGPAEIDALGAYVESLGGGPRPPTEADLDLSDANLAIGGELFRTNCAQCHNFAGKGGELTYGKSAPSLQDTTPQHIWDAMLSGPEQMPVFGDRSLSPDQKRDIIHYITYLRAQPDPGGSGLGRIGPVSEGLVGWLLGIGVLVAATVWIGARA